MVMTMRMKPAGNIRAGGVYRQQLAMWTMFWTLAGLAVMVSCTVLRTHLFIWTVFSPKYIYTMIWSVLHQGAVNVVVGTLWRWGNARLIE